MKKYIEPIEENDPSTILIAKEEPDLEPVNDFRENALQFMRILTLSIDFINQSENPRHAALGVGYALQVPSVVCLSMRARSKQMGVSSNTLSHYCQQFKLIASL